MGIPRKPPPSDEKLKAIADEIESRLKAGMSIRQSCLEIGVKYRTLATWEKKYPWFKERIDDALDFCQGWWEGVGQRNIENKNFNAALYFMHMRNRFGWTNNDNMFKHEHHGNITIKIMKFGNGGQGNNNPE